MCIRDRLQAERHGAAQQRGLRGGRVVDHADFEGGGAAQQFLGLGHVLHAGQLHHDAVRTLLLDDRFGHAQFVDPVVQRVDVLLERGVLHAGDGGRVQQMCIRDRR